MLDWTQLVFLALIQGLSEFLPISSSAHLVLPGQLLGWRDQGLLFDVAVHGGTLGAVLLYFRADIVQLIQGLFPDGMTDSWVDAEIWKFAVATLPVVIAGLLLSDLIETRLRGLAVIATTTLVFGLLLGWAAWKSRSNDSSELQQVTWRDAIVIGLFQVMALVPGVSRSGITLTAAMLLGYNSATAARFSFLLSIPVILGAITFMSAEWFGGEIPSVPASQLLLAMLISGVSAYATIAIFLDLLQRVGLMPFVLYRLILGSALVLFLIF